MAIINREGRISFKRPNDGQARNGRVNQSTIIRPTKESFREICKILNEPRPYRSSDSIRQHFIPDL